VIAGYAGSIPAGLSIKTHPGCVFTMAGIEQERGRENLGFSGAELFKPMGLKAQS